MLNVAVVGAGAIAEEVYLPTLTAVSSTTISHIVDVDADRARDMAARFGAEDVATQVDAVLDGTDAIVVATPPRYHADITESALGADVHVFTEKPIATSSARGEELVSLAEQRGLHFAISRQLRESPACRLVREFAHNGSIGVPESVRMRYGDETRWAFASDYRLRAEDAWGGALTDKGPHALDVLLWIFGPDATVTAYRDDNLGGLEANSELEFRFSGPDLVATVEITADRAIDNEIRIDGTAGAIVADPKSARATLHAGDSVDLRPETDRGTGRYRTRVAMQLRRFVGALDGEAPSYVPARQGLALVEWLEAAYAQREPLEFPWERLASAPAQEVP